MTGTAVAPAIRTERLTKYYGKSRGIIDVDLEVQPGEIFGFLGPNGAGKTTTIRLLLDLIRPTHGRAAVLGLDSRRDRIAIHRRVTYLPGELSLYGDLTGAQTLGYLANLHGGVEPGVIQSFADRLELDTSRRVKALSRGNKQKVGLVAAFMGRPELLILDEPTTGLDPLVQQEFERMVDEVRRDGRTVFLSSHILPEVEHLCDRVGIIREGRILAVETIDALKARAFRRLVIQFGGPVLAEAFDGLPGVRDMAVRDGMLSCTVIGDLDALVKTAARFHVRDIHVAETSLEEIFLAYYGEEANSHAAA
jgi:ABC-2 type transport system ATP-binding protein